MKKTIEELRAEVAAAETALQEAKLKEAEAERAEAKKRQVEEHKQESERQNAIAKALYDAMVAAGITTAKYQPGKVEDIDASGGWNNHLPKIEAMPDAYAADVQIDLERVYRHSSFRYGRSRDTGKYAIYIGRYRNYSKRYPQNKSGGFNYKKIAEEIKRRIDSYNARQAAEAEKKAKIAAAKTLIPKGKRYQMCIAPALEQSFRGRHGYNYSTYAPKDGNVYLRLGTYQTTPEIAKEVVDFLHDKGLLGENDD